MPRRAPGLEWPELLLCIHEETAVALAHGYARVTGQPLAVALHAHVGLMHATMAPSAASTLRDMSRRGAPKANTAARSAELA